MDRTLRCPASDPHIGPAGVDTEKIFWKSDVCHIRFTVAPLCLRPVSNRSASTSPIGTGSEILGGFRCWIRPQPRIARWRFPD